jgi:arylsulfatase A-like enzyme
MNRRHFIFTILHAGLLIATAGCGRQPLALSISQGVARPERSAVLLFVDGMDESLLNELLAAGKLPNIQKRFVNGGVRVNHAVASLPAMTYPNTVSLFTGCFPGHHGIMGNQLFDRDRLTWIDYITLKNYQHVNQDFTQPTIYEILDDRFTVNVQCHTQRGVRHSFDNELETGPAWFLGWHIPVNQYVASCIEQVGLLAERVRQWPSVLTFYFPGLDAAGHVSGSHSDYYAQVFEDVDHQIGRVTNALESAGLLETTYLFLVTDHGHPRANEAKSFDLGAWLCRTRGVQCHEGDVPGTGYSERFSFLDKYDAMLVDGSHRRVAVFLRGESGWGERPSEEQVVQFIDGKRKAGGPEADDPGEACRIADLPAVAFVCRSLDRDRVEVRSARGSAVVERRLAGSTKEYRVVSSEAPPSDVVTDAMGVAQSPDLSRFVGEGWHDSRQWLAKTAETKCPDFVPQIVEYFDSPRAGDFVIFTAHGWLFAGNGCGEHGSCLAEDMRIPMFFAGPELARGASIEFGRLVDVMPTLLDLLGESDRLNRHPPIDGVSLAPQLRSVRPDEPANP